MNIKIQTIKREGVPVVKSGTASDAKQFFDLIIKDQFSAVEQIKAIHKALMEYVNRKDAVFVLRLFGSDSQRNYNNLRRGFLTQYPDGSKMVFCDNTFAMPFAAIKLAGSSYTAEELISYMNNPSTRFGFGSTKEERELAYYNWNKNKANINLNTYGWYLAHIVPVGKEYGQKKLRDFFNNPNRKEWIDSSDNIRRVETDLTPAELSVLKAHFLRMVHPLNSFLVPKRSLLAYCGNNIGEEPELIKIVQDYIKEVFPEEYAELSVLMQASEMENTTNTIDIIVWSNSESIINKEKRRLKTTSKSIVKTSKETEKDIFDQDEEQKLENTLRSIGKKAFIKLYPLVKANPSISVDDVITKLPEYKDYNKGSQKSRLSSTKSILSRGLGDEALENIACSSRLSEDLRQQAQKLANL